MYLLDIVTLIDFYLALPLYWSLSREEKQNDSPLVHKDVEKHLQRYMFDYRRKKSIRRNRTPEFN